MALENALGRNEHSQHTIPHQSSVVMKRICLTQRVGAFALGLTLLSFLAIPGNAYSIPYSYTGNPYTTIAVPSSGYTTANRITATLTFANPLPANQKLAWGSAPVEPPTATETLTAFVISDGAVTFDLSDPLNIFLATGDQGQIVRWFVGGCAVPCGSTVNAFTHAGTFANAIDGSTAFSFGPLLAFNVDNPGVWAGSAPNPVPEPATLLLFGTTAAGLGLAHWRQRRRR